MSDFDLKGANAYEEVDEQFFLEASRIDRRNPDQIINNLNDSNTTSAHFQTKSSKEVAAPPQFKNEPQSQHVIYEVEELKYLEKNRIEMEQP